MYSKTLIQLEWPVLLEKIASFAQTEEGRKHTLELPCNLTTEQIESSWAETYPLRQIIRSGYRPPIGNLEPMESLFRGAKLGQILDGESLRIILALLQSVKTALAFARDFGDKCDLLNRYQKQLYPLPKLDAAISRAIGPDGKILDDASPELSRIRRNKINLRKKIESEIGTLLTKNDLETYLQDKFFTIRSDRYVVPMRLDGRGRVKGSIYDTSDSGQTLYIEPASIAPMNEALLELELSEKLEIIRIFKELSGHVAGEVDILETNYKLLIHLDIRAAQASYASEIDAGKVNLSETPSLHLVKARHPLLMKENEKIIANDIALTSEQKTLIVSGPNAGGKTVILKTTGLLHLMMKAGLLIPADESSSLFAFTNIFVEMGDAQNLSANLSTFSGHICGLKSILEKTGPEDLVLLDELAVGTEPHTGSSIAQAILEEIANLKTTAVVTTHFDSLKGLAMHDGRFRNGSMEFSKKNLKPTYHLILDIPGQSYGIELAKDLGLSPKVIERAVELRGGSAGEINQLIDSLQRKQEEAREEHEKIYKARLEVERQKEHWNHEKQELAKMKSLASNKIAERYQDAIDKIKKDFYDTVDELKTLQKKWRKLSGDPKEFQDQVQAAKKQAEDQLDQINTTLGGLEDNFAKSAELPGSPCTIEEISVGSDVYVVSLGKKATVTKIPKGPSPAIEVNAGLLKLRLPIQDLRIIDKNNRKKTAKPRVKHAPKSMEEKAIPFVIPTSINSLDLRGFDVLDAVDKTWLFIDKALMRGENQLILIHGHGTDKLKKAIRTALTVDCPYNLDFRPGEKEEGGDGVTVLKLNTN